MTSAFIRSAAIDPAPRPSVDLAIIRAQLATIMRVLQAHPLSQPKGEGR